MRNRELPVTEVKVYESETSIYDFSISGLFLGVDWLRANNTLVTRIEVACNGTLFDGWLDQAAIETLEKILGNRRTYHLRLGDFTYDRLPCRRRNGSELKWISHAQLLMYHSTEGRFVLPLRFQTKSELDSHGTYGCGLVDADSLQRNILILNA